MTETGDFIIFNSTSTVNKWWVSILLGILLIIVLLVWIRWWGNSCINTCGGKFRYKRAPSQMEVLVLGVIFALVVRLFLW